MHGVGEATSAITFVNALPTGIGAAAGIDLKVRAEVVIGPDGPRPGSVEVHPESSDRAPIRAVLAAALERAGVAEAPHVQLTIASSIPPAAGLKSSSAVISAVVQAVDRAAGRATGAGPTARFAAELSRRLGISATGAFDDALAGLSSGVVVTDNRSDRLLRVHPLAGDLGVALWIPPGKHAPSPEWAERFRVPDPRARRASEAVIAGQLWEAMRANTELVEAVMGYDYRDLRDRLGRDGALAAGTSGLGPAFAVVASRDRLSDVLRDLPSSPGERRLVDFTRGPGPEVDP